MHVVYVELATVKTSFIAIVVVHAIAMHFRMGILVLRMPCTKTVLCALRFTCPICSKLTQNMSRIWERLDQEVYLSPMPEEYHQKKVWVLCNDCGSTSDVYYHVVGYKCLGCGSYNIGSTSPPSTAPRRVDSISLIGNFSGTIESNVASPIAGSNG